MTRPKPRHSGGFDENAADEFLRDGAEELAEREAERDVWEPTGSVYDDESRFPPAPDWHNATDGLCVYAGAEDLDPLAICGVCRPVRDIVEQMIEERLGADLSDDEASRIASAEIRLMRAEKRAAAQTPLERTQRMLNEILAGIGKVTSPAASAVGDSGEEVANVNPPDVPSSPRTTWSDLADAMVEHRPSPHPDDAVAEWVGEAVAAICEALEAHRPGPGVFEGYVLCECRWSTPDYQGWLTHVAPLIAEALAPHRIYTKRGPMGEPVPVELRPMETGQDMGASFAAEFYPQHTKPQK